MHKIIILLLLIFATKTHSQQWQWARKATSTTGGQIARKVCSDHLGNVFILGFNDKSATFGGTQLGAGNFIVKYDSLGNTQWAKEIGGYPNVIHCDGSGNLYILGNFSTSITIGSAYLPNNGDNDFFLVKISPAGVINWVSSFSGPKSDEARDFVTDPNGNSFITGYFTDSIQFGSIMLKDSVNLGSITFFLAKVNSSGIVQWAGTGPYNSSGTQFNSAGRCITRSKTNHLYLIGSRDIYPFNYPIPFMAKYDEFGVLQYKTQYGSYLDHPHSLMADDSSNIYYIYNSAGHYTNRPELVKCDSSLNFKWQQKLTDNAYNSHYFLDSDLSADDSGNVYIAGNFGHNHVQKDTVFFCNDTLVSNGEHDLLVAKYDRNGNCIWTKTAGGKNDEAYSWQYPVALRSDAKGIYVAGVYNNIYPSNIYSDKPIFGNDTLINDGNWQQLFVAKISAGSTALGTHGFEKPENFMIYPNPSCGKFTMEFSGKGSLLTVRNVFGENVFTSNSPKSQVQIDLSHKPKGIYFVEIMSGSERRTRKIIIE